jgi:hypothetical protein
MENEPKEPKIGGKPRFSKSGMTFEKAIDFGEYDPNFLSQFPEWHTYSRHTQFEYIRKALKNRHRQLLTQWAELTNVLDFSLKPHVKDGLKNIENQLKELEKDKERLFIEYSS